MLSHKNTLKIAFVEGTKRSVSNNSGWHFTEWHTESAYTYLGFLPVEAGKEVLNDLEKAHSLFGADGVRRGIKTFNAQQRVKP